MTSRIRLASLLLALLTLIACGGGGSGTSSTDAAVTPTDQESAPDAAAKSMADALAGDWEGCFVDDGTPISSYIDKLHVTRISDREFTYMSKTTKSYSPDCTGEVVWSFENSGRLTLTGSVSVWDPVSKRSVPAERYEGNSVNNKTIRQLFSITEDDRLRFGDSDDRGPDGYPRSLQEWSSGRK